MFFVEKRAVLRGPRLIRNLSVDRVDDRSPHHRPLAADGDVLGTVRLGIFDAVGDDVARLIPLALYVRLTIRRARWLPVRILLRRIPRIDPAWRWRVLRRRGWALRGDARDARRQHGSRDD